MRESPLGPLPVGLRVRKVVRKGELLVEGWQVFNRRGEVLREFTDAVDAERYKDFMEGLRICDVDILIVSLMRRVEDLENK